MTGSTRRTGSPHQPVPVSTTSRAERCPGNRRSVFLRTEERPIWVWYNLLIGQVTEYMVAKDVLAAVREQTPEETNALTWKFFDGPGQRPRYYLGTDPEGQNLLVRFKTEDCGVITGYLEQTPSPEEQGQVQEIAFTPQTIPDYQDLTDSEPEVRRWPEEAHEAMEAVAAYGAFQNYGYNTWEEAACDQVFVFSYVDEENDQYGYYWSLYDTKTKRVVEHLGHQEILAAVYAQWPKDQVNIPLSRWDLWLFRSDAPGHRERYMMGYIDGREAWLHFNSKECWLLPVRVQLVRSASDMGEWFTLPITDAAVTPRSALDSDQDPPESEEESPAFAAPTAHLPENFSVRRRM